MTTTTSALAPSAIPHSHMDLLTRPVCGVLTTVGRDGRLQSSLVWVDFDGVCPRINTTIQRQKGRNMVANPRVSLLIVDPDDTSRFIQVRGQAELVAGGAIDHLDSLTRSYTAHPRFYGYVYPESRQFDETRVICRIHPKRVTTDAIHA